MKQHATASQIMPQSSHTSHASSCSSNPFMHPTIPSPLPAPPPLTLPPQPPPNPHLTQPLQHQQTGPTSGTDVRWLATSCGKPAQSLPGCGRVLVRLQSRPRVAPRGPDGHICATCDSQGQELNEGTSDYAMGRHGTDAGCGLGGWGYLQDFATSCEWILVGLWAPGAARAAARMANPWL